MSLTVGVPFLLSGTATGMRQNSQMASVKALVFDTFGTVVDWRASVTKEVEDLARRKVSRSMARSSPMRGVAATRRA